MQLVSRNNHKAFTQQDVQNNVTKVRVLCFLLTLYGLAVFGYFTATLATYFMGRNTESEHAEITGSGPIEALQRHITALGKRFKDYTGSKARIICKAALYPSSL